MFETLLENIEKFREDAFMMHSREVFRGNGGSEFSYMTFFDTETGEWDVPEITDSMNDSAVTTTSVIAGEDAVYINNRMQENPNLIYVWGHSHANMQTGPSGRDIQTIKEQGLRLSVITNNKGDLNVLILHEGEVYEITKNSTAVYATTTYSRAAKPKVTTGKPKYNASNSVKQYEQQDLTDGYNTGQYFENYVDY